jgi:hypothetical protein
MKWAYGVTTVPARKDDLLPRTLASLANAGFESPRLFVDGCNDPSGYSAFGLEVTVRSPKIRTVGNWVLGMTELYFREPNADRYVIFEDDIIACRNMRQYLEAYPYLDNAYYNLYTSKRNHDFIPASMGWHRSNQRGNGALALAFDNKTIQTLLWHPRFARQIQNPATGWKLLDGGILLSMREAGWSEYVHNPSLVQHVGTVSSMGNPEYPPSPSFRGESFDAMELTK